MKPFQRARDWRAGAKKCMHGFYRDGRPKDRPGHRMCSFHGPAGWRCTENECPCAQMVTIVGKAVNDAT